MRICSLATVLFSSLAISLGASASDGKKGQQSLFIQVDESILTMSMISSDNSTSVVIEPIHNFGLNISLDNLAIRKSSEVIVGFDNGPILYQVEPKINSSAVISGIIREVVH
ncbi:hypothetical protein GYMLUDRAFT_56865 [Collybiopsis luxurians FD-317 M1]|nr:hypothetical protein GYMLUDRAFT_56865 [Collybiopsis luxurians FD-317 M1]